MVTDYRASQYKILRIVKIEDGKKKPNHTYRIIEVEMKNNRRGKFWYILEINLNIGSGWYERRRSIHYDIIEKEYKKLF